MLVIIKGNEVPVLRTEKKVETVIVNAKTMAMCIDTLNMKVDL